MCIKLNIPSFKLNKNLRKNNDVYAIILIFRRNFNLDRNFYKNHFIIMIVSGILSYLYTFYIFISSTQH